MKIGDVVAYLDSRFHPEYQEDYDNSGFLVGSREADYTGALVALDLTEAVADEAMAAGLNLIVTHHPLIFSGVKRLTSDTVLGRTLLTLVQRGLNVYAAHTNLDNLPWGVSRALADKLGLQEVRVLRPLAGQTMPGSDEAVGSGMVGQLAHAERCDVLLQRVKQLTGQPTLRCGGGDLQRQVQRVALCGGAGAFLIADALAAGADLYLTADLKYHDFQRSDGQMVVADLGHYESEQFAKEIIFNVILEKFSNFACRISAVQEGLVSYI